LGNNGLQIIVPEGSPSGFRELKVVYTLIILKFNTMEDKILNPFLSQGDGETPPEAAPEAAPEETPEEGKEEEPL